MMKYSVGDPVRVIKYDYADKRYDDVVGHTGVIRYLHTDEDMFHYTVVFDSPPPNQWLEEEDPYEFFEEKELELYFDEDIDIKDYL